MILFELFHINYIDIYIKMGQMKQNKRNKRKTAEAKAQTNKHGNPHMN